MIRAVSLLEPRPMFGMRKRTDGRRGVNVVPASTAIAMTSPDARKYNSRPSPRQIGLFPPLSETCHCPRPEGNGRTRTSGLVDSFDSYATHAPFGEKTPLLSSNDVLTKGVNFGSPRSEIVNRSALVAGICLYTSSWDPSGEKLLGNTNSGTSASRLRSPPSIGLRNGCAIPFTLMANASSLESALHASDA